MGLRLMRRRLMAWRHMHRRLRRLFSTHRHSTSRRPTVLGQPGRRGHDGASAGSHSATHGETAGRDGASADTHAHPHTAEPLSTHFPWLADLDEQLRRLSDQALDERRAELEAIGNYLESIDGTQGLRRLETALVEGGLPAHAAGAELELIREIFRPETLRAMLANPAAGAAALQAGGGSAVRMAEDFALARAPVGPVLIIGSGNTLLPAVTAAVLAYLAGNPVVLQAARLHREALPAWFDELPWPGREMLHFPGLDHSRPEEARRLHRLVREVPWGAVNLWGGRAALDAVIPEIARNPQRPRIVAMEPLTGVALVEAGSSDAAAAGRDLEKTARALANAVATMGQQLCSSPTEGYVVAEGLSAEEGLAWTRDLARAVSAEFARQDEDVRKDSAPPALPAGTAIHLDRMLQAAEQAGAEVLRRPDGRSDGAVLVSRGRSVFQTKPDIPALGIHERRRIIELIVLPDLSSAEELIRSLPERPTHREIQRVQTILSLGGPDFMRRNIDVARRVGAYRVIDEAFVLRRHVLEPLDGRHLLNEFTRQIAVAGAPARTVHTESRKLPPNVGEVGADS